jgi:hypothetical protein
MFTSLSTGANLMLCLTWLVVSTLCLSQLPTSAATFLLPTLFLGAGAGVLQARARSRAAESLKSTKSIFGARRVLLGSTDGKAATWLLVLTGVALVAGLWPLTGNPSFLTLFCGYAMFSFAREWFGLPGTYKFQ